MKCRLLVAEKWEAGMDGAERRGAAGMKMGKKMQAGKLEAEREKQ